MNASTTQLLTAALATAALTTGANAATVIDFNGIATGTTVTTQVPGLSISASSPYADSPEQVFAWDFNGYPQFDFAGQQAPFTSGNATGRDLGQGLALRGPRASSPASASCPSPSPPRWRSVAPPARSTSPSTRPWTASASPSSTWKAPRSSAPTRASSSTS